MAQPSKLDQRLQFMQLDTNARKRITDVQGIIAASIPSALEAFYERMLQVPETAAFFSSENQIQGAKNRQNLHWDRIAKSRIQKFTRVCNALRCVG